MIKDKHVSGLIEASMKQKRIAIDTRSEYVIPNPFRYDVVPDHLKEIPPPAHFQNLPIKDCKVYLHTGDKKELQINGGECSFLSVQEMKLTLQVPDMEAAYSLHRAFLEGDRIGIELSFIAFMDKIQETKYTTLKTYHITEISAEVGFSTGLNHSLVHIHLITNPFVDIEIY